MYAVGKVTEVQKRPPDHTIKEYLSRLFRFSLHEKHHSWGGVCQLAMANWNKAIGVT